jgi:hypothetical protein
VRPRVSLLHLSTFCPLLGFLCTLHLNFLDSSPSLLLPSWSEHQQGAVPLGLPYVFPSHGVEFRLQSSSFGCVNQDPLLPILPSSTMTTTTSLFASTSASTFLPTRQTIQSRPLPVVRRPLIVGKRYLLDISKCNIECPNCLALHWMGELSSKGTQRRPSFHTCCKDGSIHLPPLLDAPLYLQHLLSRTTAGTFLSLHSIDCANV